MHTLRLCLNCMCFGLSLAQMLVAVVFASSLAPAFALAEEVKIGGTGGALATMRILADAYQKTHPEVKLTVLPSLGSSGGIKAILAGSIQIAVSARPLKASEASLGVSAVECGRTPFVFAVPSKTAIDAITEKDVVEIYSGGRNRWPDGTRIRVVLRPVGDFDSEMVKSISPEVRRAKLAAEGRPGMLFAVNDQEAAESIEKTQGAFGTSTLAQIFTEQRALKVLRFNGVPPSAKAVADGSYPYYKPLLIVTGPEAPASAREFIAFVRSAAGREILVRAGYSVY